MKFKFKKNFFCAKYSICQNGNNSATLQEGIPQSPCSSFMEMKNGNISKTSAYETNFTSKSTSHFTPFYRIVILQNPKSTCSSQTIDCDWKTDYKRTIVMGKSKKIHWTAFHNYSKRRSKLSMKSFNLLKKKMPNLVGRE